MSPAAAAGAGTPRIVFPPINVADFLASFDLLVSASTDNEGCSNSILEAMSLGVPVVASENGTRPPQVLTYEAGGAKDLANQIIYALDHLVALRASLEAVVVPDTLGDEVRVLTNAVERLG